MSVRINVSLIKCGQCGKRYSNPLTHVCVTSRARRPHPVQIKPRVSYDCPKCGKPVTNPLTHVCVIRTDFRQRLAAERKRKAAERRAKARAGRAAEQHDYHSCRDPDCRRRMCVAFREGFEEGVANCPLSHI